MSEDNKEFLLVEAEDDYVVNKKRYARPRPGLYPSEASTEYTVDNFTFKQGKCLRASWYRSRGATRDKVSAGLIMKGILGKGAEVAIVNRWKEMGIWVDNNIKFFNSQYVLSGEMDAIVKNPITGGLIGYEIKSYYGYYANKQITGSKRPPKTGEPKVEHLMQSLLYAWEYRGEFEEYRLYYIERGDGHRIEFRIGIDEDTKKCWFQPIEGKYWSYFTGEKVYMPFTIDDLHSRLQQLLNHIRESRLPAKDYGTPYTPEEVEYLHSKSEIGKTKYEAWKKDPAKNKIVTWHCEYCSYSTQCAQDELTSVLDKE